MTAKILIGRNPANPPEGSRPARALRHCTLLAVAPAFQRRWIRVGAPVAVIAAIGPIAASKAPAVVTQDEDFGALEGVADLAIIGV